MSSASCQNKWLKDAPALGSRLHFEIAWLRSSRLSVVERRALLVSVDHLKRGLQSHVYLWLEEPYSRYSLWVLEVDKTFSFKPVADVLPGKEVEECIARGAIEVYIEHASYNGVPIHVAGGRTK